MAKITLGYWDIRGLGEQIRWLLHYKKVKFEDKRYHYGENEWENDKLHLDMDFPNLPYYLEGDIKLSQSTAILRYLAKKHGLDGKTEEQKLKISVVEQQLFDMRWHLAIVCLREDYEERKPKFSKKAEELMKLLSKFLGDNKFLIGDEVTYVDFMAYDTIDYYRLFIPSVLDGFSNLRNYQSRVKGLPELQEYVQSSTYKRWPIFGHFLHWGSKGEEPKID